MEVPQCHYPGHSGRHGVPGAHPGEGHHPLHSQLEKAYHHCPPRLRRRVQERGGPGAPGRQGGAAGHQGRRHEEKYPIHEFTESGGIIQGLHNLDKSIQSFARACFNYALDTNQDLWFATKDTISKKYDHRFKDIFQEIYDSEYAGKFQEAGIEYFYTLIDDAVARVVRSEGGYIWACKNYDGDVMSDMVATAFGSLAMMTSVLVSPDGTCEYEAAHGTVQRHYYKYLKGESTSTNSVATIFAWTGALRKRGELDQNVPLVSFANKLERATIETIESGVMTGDLAAMSTLPQVQRVDTEGFLQAIRQRLDALL